MSETAEFKPSIAYRIGGLDELRGVAILLVMFAHFFEVRRISPLFESMHIGSWGVDIFFIISGFLIGKILLSADRHDHFFRKFYIRRFFRIAPLYFVMVTLVLAASILAAQNYASWPFYFTFTQNLIPESEHLGDVVSSSYEALPTLTPMWSLAVEEHFYAVMPMMIFFLPRNALKWSLFFIALVGLALKQYITLDITRSSLIAYTNPFETWFRMQYLAFGVLLNFPDYKKLISLCGAFWFILILATSAWTALLELALGAVALLFIVAAIENRFVMKNRALAWLGVHCFGLYLLHTPIRAIVNGLTGRLEKFVGDMPQVVWFIPFMITSVIAAHLSFRYFEMPVQRLRSRFEGRQTKTPLQLAEEVTST